jgi:hypothetical protein
LFFVYSVCKNYNFDEVKFYKNIVEKIKYLNMKRNLLLLACLCIVGTASAQEKVQSVSIGIPLPDASAVLHVQSESQGVLIPNVIITDVTNNNPIGSSIKESLLVYNKQEKKVGEKIEVAKGYYYWVATTATTGKWVRVITSQDTSEILDGQVQESFIEEVIDNGQGQLLGTGIFVYTPDKKEASNPNAPGRLKLDIPDLVKKNQTLTTFGVSQFELYHYMDGKKYRTKLPPSQAEDIGNFLTKTTTELELVYTDEKGELNKFAVRDLLGANNDDIPAITDLTVNSDNTGLVFTNDKGVEIPVSLEIIVKKLEAKTSLEINANDELVYINENGLGNTYKFPLRTIVKEPWLVAETAKEATMNNQNIFLNGWVGIGLKAKDAATAVTNLKPDEKLRVDGSIYARNSYYADYVFENYFTKETSDLKYDYKFNDLNTVEYFIKQNRHLPGITPISSLDKSNEEGYLINVSELSVQLLEKVEELYLHTIEQQKIINKQEERLKQIEVLLNINKK